MLFRSKGRTRSPLELGLDWLVDFSKPNFTGRRALAEEKRRGPTWRLVKLDIEGNKPAPGAIIYDSEGCNKDIGYVTSAMWSPAVKANIALAMIKTEYLKGEIWVEVYYYKDNRPYRRMALGTQKKKPFWVHPRARTTPPSDF